jgi:hypothetical protein
MVSPVSVRLTSFVDPRLAAAFVHTIHWKAGQFSWTHSDNPEEALHSYEVATKPWKRRFRCKKCGCCIASQNTKIDKWSTWGGQLDRDENARIKNWDVIKPTDHIFYETRMLDVNDELPKWKGYGNDSERLA